MVKIINNKKYMGCTGYPTNNNFDYFYQTRNDGCFSGNGKVKLMNNKFKLVKNLNKGDILENGAEVQCLIIININKTIPVIELNYVYYTLKHPIKLNGKWTNPISIKPPKFVFIDKWYNLVLKNGYSVKINGIEAITLGHNQKDKVAYHPYFGTYKVINALKKYESFKDGKISIKNNLKIERDENGRICKYY